MGERLCVWVGGRVRLWVSGQGAGGWQMGGIDVNIGVVWWGVMGRISGGGLHALGWSGLGLQQASHP